jgi:prevent-host-death family protein
MTSFGMEGVPMGRVGATEFKAKCLELMDRVAERRETFVITKRGKAVARLVPMERRPEEPLFGRLRDLFDEVGDIRAPVTSATEWESVAAARPARRERRRRKRR